MRSDDFSQTLPHAAGSTESPAYSDAQRELTLYYASHHVHDLKSQDAGLQCWQEFRCVSQSLGYPVCVHLSGQMLCRYPGRQWNPLKHTLGSPLNCSGLWAENNRNEPELVCVLWTPIHYRPLLTFYYVIISCSCTAPERSHWGLWLTFHPSSCLIFIPFISRWCQCHQQLSHKSRRFCQKKQKKKLLLQTVFSSCTPVRSGWGYSHHVHGHPAFQSCIPPGGEAVEVIYAGRLDRCVYTDWACWPISLEGLAVHINTQDFCSTRTCWGQAQVSRGMFMWVSMGCMQCASASACFCSILPQLKQCWGWNYLSGEYPKHEQRTRNGFRHWMQCSKLIYLAMFWNCTRITMLSPLSLANPFLAHFLAWTLQIISITTLNVRYLH